ncbi:hypothetical protein KKHLCK_12055 [Candidatus Electrothrix laxa]
MCGITGFFDFTHNSNQSVLTKMTDALIHRGPDDSGTELIKTDRALLGLGHRRLSIIDLSAEGKQPMTSASGRYVICFNGEIYNFQDIRAELEHIGTAPRWRGHSDTEVLLAAVEHWGLQQALQKSVGMFALALWDKKEQTLSLARDRMGEKPLYYGWQGKTFLFGSELKALREHPVWQGNIDRGALCLYMRHGYIPAPYSIYQGISKLTQGTILRIGINNGQNQQLRPKPYWSLLDVVRSGVENPFPGDGQEAVDELERLLLGAVARQMISDAPLGAFLSGGYDSSLIVALMQAQSTQPVKTFSIGFHEQKYNEAPHAKAVAEHLGTDHTELYVTSKQAMEVITKLPQLYDEPFADSSQIPTFLLAKMTREHVTVALSGDGGDELMRGYSRYNQTKTIWEKLKPIPKGVRRTIGKSLKAVPAPVWDASLFWAETMLRPYVASGPVSYQINKGAGAFLQPDFYTLYRSLMSIWDEPGKVVKDGQEPKTLFDSIGRNRLFQDLDRGMLYLDSMTYLPDDILVKVDRAAMGVSLETRIPLLDHNVIEFIWSLPNNFRWQNGISKWALRQVLYKYVPRNILDRPKKGFAIPINDWVRDPLKDWAGDSLSREKLKKQNLFQTNIVEQAWEDHLNGNTRSCLWPVLMTEGVSSNSNFTL